MSTVWAFLFFCVLCCTVVKVMSLQKRDKDHRLFGAEDAEIMQEIHRGLHRMEQRVEALETIIMDRSPRRPVHSEYE